MKKVAIVELACQWCVMPENYSGLAIVDFNGTRICSSCNDHRERSFEGAEGLINNLNLGSQERVGVTVSGGKDSLYAWMHLVELLGSERVVAFNHHKAKLVHPIAEENIQKAAKILDSEAVIVRDESFFPRFTRNMEAFLQKPDAAMVKVVLCSGCRYGIRGQMFHEGLKFGISKFVNANSYLEQNPFKIALLSTKGNGSYAEGVLTGLHENEGYLQGDTMDAIKRDHEYWPSGKVFSEMPEFYSQIQHFSFDRYFPSNPAVCQEAVERRLDWKCPERSWHFDCQVESFKDLFYYGLLGYTETESKLSAMVRHGLINRDMAIEKLNAYRERMQFAKTEVEYLLEEMDIAHLLPAINDFCEKSHFLPN